MHRVRLDTGGEDRGGGCVADMTDNGEHLEEYIRTDPQADLLIAQEIGKLLRAERIQGVRAQLHQAMQAMESDYDVEAADRQIDLMAEAFA